MPAVSEGGEVHTRMCQFDVFINNRISSILFYKFSSVEVSENVQIVLLDSSLINEVLASCCHGALLIISSWHLWITYSLMI